MGTNYYLHAPKCFHCGKEEEPPIHLGKSSWGWCFSLHIKPEEGIYDWQDVQALIEEKLCSEWCIKNEYDEQISLVDFIKTVTERNGSLMRHTIDHWHCIGHGKGTYDYIIGEFS